MLDFDVRDIFVTMHILLCKVKCLIADYEMVYGLDYILIHSNSFRNIYFKIVSCREKQILILHKI